MTSSERLHCRIPEKFNLSAEEVFQVHSLKCSGGHFQGIGQFKECFYFFHHLNIQKQFNITAEQMFQFLTALSERYTDVPYHNWTHATDVAQCAFFMVKQGKLAEEYEPWEIFVLLTAALCHDANHQGTDNAFNTKAQTPLGMLFLDQSVMEVHSVDVAITVIEDVGLFAAFDQQLLRKAWRLFINLILATDLTHHFSYIKPAQVAIDAEAFDMTNEAMRVLGLQLILKGACLSNVCRPFEIATKWCDLLFMEVFAQRDIEKQSGIGLTAPGNDKEAADRPQTEIRFVNVTCLPLYTVIAKLWPPLEVMLDALRANLDKWKELRQG
jgi:hypothetical protein